MILMISEANFEQKYFLISEYILGESRTEMKRYLDSFGTFPAFAQSDWKASDLNFTKLFEEFNFAALYHYNLVPCNDNSSAKICVQKFPEDFGVFNRDGTLGHFGLGNYENLVDTMKSFNIPRDKMKASLANYWKYRFGKPPLMEADVRNISDKAFNPFSLYQPAEPEEMFKLTTDELKVKIIDRDWQKLLNFNLPAKLHINVSDKIRVPKSFIENVVKQEIYFEKEIIADGALLEFLKQKRDYIEFEPFEHNDRHQTKRAWPRTETCGHNIGRKSYMSVAVDALVMRRFIDEERRLSFKKLVEMVRDQMLEEAKGINITKNMSFELFIAFKDHRIIGDDYLSALYKNLDLNGSESLFESLNEIDWFENFMSAQTNHLSEDDKMSFEVARQFYHNDPAACVFLSDKHYYCEL